MLSLLFGKRVYENRLSVLFLFYRWSHFERLKLKCEILESVVVSLIKWNSS